MAAITNTALIPDEILIPAVERVITETQRGVDGWGELERATARGYCGPGFEHIESDWVGQRAIALRKGDKLRPILKGNARPKKYKPPAGDYERYLRSDHWQEFRQVILEFWGHTCSICDQPAGKGKPLDVHHRTYKRRGRERIQDCVVLCRICHMKIHRELPDGNNIQDWN